LPVGGRPMYSPWWVDDRPDKRIQSASNSTQLPRWASVGSAGHVWASGLWSCFRTLRWLLAGFVFIRLWTMTPNSVLGIPIPQDQRYRGSSRSRPGQLDVGAAARSRTPGFVCRGGSGTPRAAA
jgi:hypothetical protein